MPKISERITAMPPGGSWRLLYRMPWLVLHLVIGLPLTLLSFVPPGKDLMIRGQSVNERMRRWWAADICRIFGLHRRVSGTFINGPILVVSNHISWLDIQLLHSVSSMGFVAKAEIERWPLAGWLARLGDTVFHHRGSHDSASSVVAEMRRRLEEGRKVAIFAEGGVLPGFGIKRFHARLFAAAIESETPVQPVMVRYLRAGLPYPEITFRPNEPFMTNFFRLLRQPACTAELVILPAISPQGKLRRELASEAQAAVAAAFASDRF